MSEKGISALCDATGTSVGRRYARLDEIGIPFGITVDFDTINDQKVTLREIHTMKQIRLPLNDVVKVIKDCMDGFTSWDELLT